MVISNSQINSVNDVRQFFKHLLEVESLNFHPDNSFEEYINLETKHATYTKEEANIRNQLMNQCFEVCMAHGEDYIYLVASEAG